jgi:hypothetical protein
MGNDTTIIEAIFNSTVNLTCSAYGNPKPTVNKSFGKDANILSSLVDCLV